MAEQQGPIVAWHARGDGAFETFLLLDQVLVGVNERRLENVFGDGGPDIPGQCHEFGCGRGCGHRLMGDGAQGGQGRLPRCRDPSRRCGGREGVELSYGE